MAIPATGSKEVDLLVALYLEAAERLRRLLTQMLGVDIGRRLVIFQRIERILERLELETDRWSAQHIRSFFEEADAKALGRLRPQFPELTFGSTINEQAVAVVANSLRNTLSSGRASVHQLATRLLRRTALANEFPDLEAAIQRELGIGLAQAERTSRIEAGIAARLAERFEDDIVTVIARNGRRMTFPLDFYAGMVASASRRQATSIATVERAQEAGHDLVRVSANKSKGGDWCDAYRGRVFSVSGSDPRFPPLASLPNGGPPFHPWCRHSLSVFIEAFSSPEEMAELGAVDEQFLLKPNEETPNRIARNWWRAVAEVGEPAPLPAEFV